LFFVLKISYLVILFFVRSFDYIVLRQIEKKNHNNSIPACKQPYMIFPTWKNNILKTEESQVVHYILNPLYCWICIFYFSNRHWCLYKK